MQCKERLESYLQEQHVPFHEQQHERVLSAQQVAECEHISSKKFAKEVIAFADGKMIELSLPASCYVDLEKIRTALGAKEVLLAQEKELADAFPDCEVGAMPPFGNLYGLPVYVEKSLTTQEEITFPIGTHTETMSVRYADFANLVHPHVMEFARSSSAV